MASATSKDSIQANPECSTLPDHECCTEVNEVSSTTSEMVIVTQKMIKSLDDMQTEIVTGNFFIPNHFCNSELV